MINRWLRWGTVFNEDGEPHFNRLPLILFPKRLGTLYLHHFVNGDDGRPPHNHPKWFITIGLRGWYTEQVYDDQGGFMGTKEWKAPWIRAFPATYTHRIIACEDAWTLVITGPYTGRWGFFTKEGFVESSKYYRSSG